jgi:hypothetical protein
LGRGGKSDAAVFRPSTGQWFIRKSSGGTILTDWGLANDVPVTGDFDGDGKTDFTVWRPDSGLWFTLFSRGGAAVAAWGVDGDRPSGRHPQANP